jgi:hypothetical protein
VHTPPRPLELRKGEVPELRAAPAVETP